MHSQHEVGTFDAKVEESPRARARCEFASVLGWGGVGGVAAKFILTES